MTDKTMPDGRTQHRLEQAELTCRMLEAYTQLARTDPDPHVHLDLLHRVNPAFLAGWLRASQAAVEYFLDVTATSILSVEHSKEDRRGRPLPDK